MFCIERGTLGGRFPAPPSKPYSQRFILAAALADGETIIDGVELSDDVIAALRAVKPLASVRLEGASVMINRREPERLRAFSVMESGFVLRASTAIYTGVPGITAILYGGTLLKRPLGELVDALRGLARVVWAPGLVVVEGRRLESFHVRVRADISSQYISGLMYLAALCGSGVVEPLGERRSWSFVEATAEALKAFGARVSVGSVVEVSGTLRSPGSIKVPGDFSLAAFLAVAALATGGTVEIACTVASTDRPLLEALEKMGARISEAGGVVRVSGALARGVDADLRHNTDLVMPLALAAATVEDLSVIRGVEHLRFKESDRINSVIDVLRRLGAYAEYKDGTLHVRGPLRRGGVVLSSHGDHRIGLMALAALKIVGGCVDDVSPVAKSWPSAVLYFFEGSGSRS
jgi:3-phosphoshikimate 1-carboxyvinyltransferase